MRAAYQKFSGARGFTPEDFRAVAEQVAGTNLQAFWASAVQGTTELDYSEALETFGLRFTSPSPAGRPFTGMATRNDAGRLVVTQVRRDTPADASGINVDDEILAIGDFRVRADQWNNRLDQYKAGEKVSVLVARRDQLMRIDLTLGSEPPRSWRLEANPSASESQKQQLSRWLQAAS
jgi:predicted metalloprotease with PDZ domain